MKEQDTSNQSAFSGDDLLTMLEALANPHRLRIVATLAKGRNYVSQLAREIRMSRPLLYMHLQRLENAGLVWGHLELSKDGKAVKYFEISPFALYLTPERITEMVETLTIREPVGSASESTRKERDGK
jgi:predicted transcriptional regulator